MSDGAVSTGRREQADRRAAREARRAARSRASPFRTTSAATRSPGELHDALTASATREWLESNPTRVQRRRPHDGQARHGQGELREDRRTAPGRSSCSCSRGARATATRPSRAGTSATSSAPTGVLFRTSTGELSVRAETVRLLVKSLRPLPDKWHGLADTETRYRQRYVDLIVNEQSRERVPRAHAHRALPARLSRRARLPGSRDADDAADPRRRRGAAVRHASQRARSWTCTCASRRSCT